MKMMLAENIRAFRKERSLTQEQLSEALGVTAGAVYKWEAKLSIPELEMIIQMADFFDTSVNVLVGYEVKDNRMEAMVKRLMEYRRNKDWEGLAEAEKALKKYPYSFQIVKQCAALYSMFGSESGDKSLYHRALELVEQAFPLLGQNDDPEISEQTLYGKMAEIYLGLDEPEKAVELWKAHNADGVNNASIGHILAQSGNVDEAIPFLSKALVKIISDLVGTMVGYMNVYLKHGDYESSQAILKWGIGLLLGLRKANKPNYLDRVSAACLVTLAASQFMAGQRDEARETLKEARDLAAFFDASPSYDESDIRFITRIEGASAYDEMGATAMKAVERAVYEMDHASSLLDREGFIALWNELSNQ